MGARERIDRYRAGQSSPATPQESRVQTRIAQARQQLATQTVAKPHSAEERQPLADTGGDGILRKGRGAEKHQIAAPSRGYQSQNAGFARSGQDRDSYDSQLRARNSEKERKALQQQQYSIQQTLVGMDYNNPDRAALLDRIATMDGQIKALSKQLPSPWERVGDSLAGAGQQTAGALMNLAGTMQEFTAGGNPWNNFLRMEQDSAQRSLAMEPENAMAGSRLAQAQKGLQQAQEAPARMQEVADKWTQAGAKRVERAKLGYGGFGRFAVDAAVAGTQMAGDILLGGGNALIPMAARSFGGAAQTARQDGAPLEQQLGYGAGKAALAMATERMFSLSKPFQKVFGTGYLDKAVEAVAGRLTSSAAGRMVLAMGGEGLEEMVESSLDPLAKLIYQSDDSQSAWENISRSYGANFDLGEMLYEGLIGATLGGIGGAVENVSTGSGRSRQIQEQQQQKDFETAMDDAYATMGQEGMFSPTSRAAVEAALAQEPRVKAGGMPRREDFLRGQQAASDEGATAARTQDSREGRPHPAPQVGEQKPTQGQTLAREQLRRAGVALGENGQKAVQAAFDGKVATDVYYGGFAAYYEAGLSGQAAARVRTAYSGKLSPAQRLAAYAAGQKDGAMSLAKEQRAAQFAPVAGTDSGLVYDSYVESELEATMAERVNSMARLLGTRVRFVDSVRGGTANAQIQGAEILLEKGNENPVLLLLGHELTHRLQTLAPKEYRSFRKAIAGTLGQEAQVQLDAYARQGESLSYEAALDEAVASYAGELLTDGRVMDSFIERNRENRTLLERLREAIRELVRRLRGQEGQQARAAEAKLTAALKAGAKQAEALTAQQNTDLQGAVDGDTMGGPQHSLKEDLQNGRAREESRERFLHRCTDGGYEVFEGDTAAYGYRHVYVGSNQNARQIQEELTNLGVPCAVGDGVVLWNRNGFSGQRNHAESVTVEGRKVLISSNAEVSARNSAGHEAFHLWKNGTVRDTFVETIEENLIYTSVAFQEYQSIIADAYFTDSVELSDSAKMAKLHEEIYAYISGDIHQGTNDEILRPMFRDYDAVKAAWETLVEAQKNTATKGGEVRYSLNTDFGRQFDQWMEQTDEIDRRTQSGGYFEIGTTSEALKSIGVRKDSIYWRKQKIGYIMSEHPEMDADTIKQVPGIIENPVVIMKSATREDSIVLLGDVVAADGKRVMAALELTPRQSGGMESEFTLLTSAYGRSDGNLRNLIQNSEILYMDPDKKRTNTWLMSLRVQFPSDQPTYGSMGSISYQEGKVNIRGKTFSELGGELTAPAAFEKGTANSRHSLKGTENARELAALREENNLLRLRIDHWRKQARPTKRITTEKKAVERTARALIKEYGATVETAEVADKLQGLYDYIASGTDGKNELVYTQVRERTEEIARTLVENAAALDSESYHQYGDLRRFLRGTTLTLSQSDSSSISDFNAFRKENFGRMRIGTGRTNVDSVYGELSQRWPEFFDEQREMHPADQLVHIADVLAKLYDIAEYNPFAPYMEQAVSGAANEIMEQFFDLPQTKATLADRQAQKLDREKARTRQRLATLREESNQRLETLRQQNKERTQDAIAKERQRREAQVDKLKAHYKAMDAAGRERRSAQELRAKLVRHVKKLSEKLLRPSDKQHIPEALREATAALLEAINLESQYTLDQATGKRVKQTEGLPVKRTEAFRALREQYEAILAGQTNFSGVVDPDLLANLTEAIAMRDKRLMDMGTEELETLWRCVRAMEGAIQSENKLLGQSRFRGVRELAESIRQSSASKRAKGNWSGAAGWGDRLLNVDMMTPLTFFHLFGEGGDALFHGLQAARDNRTRILDAVIEQTKAVISKVDVTALQTKAHHFQVEGGELTLTTAQLMSLYELSKRKQAQNHIYKGGLRGTANESGVSQEKSAKENLAAALGKLDAPSASVRVSQEDVARMLDSLTAEEKTLADGLQHIMGDYLAQQGNKESMKVYGYQKFTAEHYFPIRSDPHQLASQVGDVLASGESRPRSIAEWGGAKGTVDKASNGILLGSIFDVFAQHTVDMATYAAYLGAMEDITRVRNFTFRDGTGQRLLAMGDILQRVSGMSGEAYLNKLLQDVSAGTAKASVSGLSKLTANYKAASVGANIRVALQQPTSYLRAAAVISPKYLADPRVLQPGGWAKALEYAPIAKWKSWGNFEINQGRQLQDILFNTDSKLERLKNFSMKLTSGMDSLTWGRIWNACELEIADKQPALARDTKAFTAAVSQRFTDVVDQTQVVDNVLGRSQLMRSDDELAKMATSYMGEPTQSYNQTYRAYRDWSQEQDSTRRTAAKKRLGSSLVALTASQLVLAIAQSLWDAVRDDEERDTKYWERVLGHILPNFAGNANPMGMVPYIKDVWSVLQGYEVKRMDLATITSLISACQSMDKAIKGEGKYTLAGASANLSAELARIVGLPVATVKRDLAAVARSVAIETGDWYFQYQLEKALNSVGYAGNRGEFYDIAFGALSNGEMDVYRRIAQDLAERGVKPSTIERAMRERLEKAVEENPDFALNQVALDLIGSQSHYESTRAKEADSFTAEMLGAADYQRYAAQRAANYRQMTDSLESYDSFQAMDNATKNKALDTAYTLAEKLSLAEHSGGQYEADSKWMVWATGGEKYGVDETEAILFKIAYDMASSDVGEDGKPISGSKKENTLAAAAELLPWLSGAEMDYLKSNYWNQ